MNAAKSESQSMTLINWGWVNPSAPISESALSARSSLQPPSKPTFDLLSPIRRWLDGVEVTDAKAARSLCQWIPAQCPFERDIKVLGRTLLHIPPMCKLNPVYEEVVALRFRALCFLADVCGEDVTPYC